MKIEVGKFYATRERCRVECICYNRVLGRFLFVTEDFIPYVVDETGKFNRHMDTDNDIIAEWVEEPVVDWYPAWANWRAMDNDLVWYW